MIALEGCFADLFALIYTFNIVCLNICLLLPSSKDARLPVQLQRAMAAEAEAAREARAKVIAAEGEQKASRALKEASEVIAESSSALQLRYLQVLQNAKTSKLNFEKEKGKKC